MRWRAHAGVPKNADDAMSGLEPRVLRDTLIAIGASTGGTEALREIFAALPADFPGIVIAQHMPEAFTAAFAKRLDEVSRFKVSEAQGGERIEPGTAFVAPGRAHLLVRRVGAAFVTELSDAPPVEHCRPSVDVLFRSVAVQAKQHAIGVILTGMGHDGAAGLQAMRKAGAWTLGQDRASSLVYGMPKVAAELGCLDEVAPLGGIVARLTARLREMSR